MFNILVVDDDPNILELVTLNLKLSKYSVETAVDGATGLAKAKEGNFDAVILDIMLPKLDGFTVCEQLRSDSKTADLPIIMLTAKVNLEDKVLGFEVDSLLPL